MFDVLSFFLIRWHAKESDSVCVIENVLWVNSVSTIVTSYFGLSLASQLKEGVGLHIRVVSPSLGHLETHSLFA